MTIRLPRIIVAGLSGDSGKTAVSLSVLRALKNRGLTVATFKKGPDYIDSAWLSAVGGSPCRNLDTYMVHRSKVRDRFFATANSSNVALVEGNRGVYDGKDAVGTHSTAELAKLLDTPVILVVNVTKTTRTVAALVDGCIRFDQDVKFAGVILNKVAGERHKSILTASIEKYCGIPVLGALPKLGADAALIPGRHLGLVTPSEFVDNDKLGDKLTRIADSYLDVDAILDIANSAPGVEIESSDKTSPVNSHVTIGCFKDSVFTFYYPENLEALRAAGGELVEISSLEDKSLPNIDGLYIGGGFPETHADRLSNNQSLMNSVKMYVEEGLPVYAECGGLIYLCRSLRWNDNVYPMAGVFDLNLEIMKKPAGHGYTLCEIDGESVFYEAGEEVKGHEFHYSCPVEGSTIPSTCADVKTGVGAGARRDGLVYKSVFASYMHIHADGNPKWAGAFVKAASAYRSRIVSDTASSNGAAESDGLAGGSEDSNDSGLGKEAAGISLSPC